MFIFERKHKQGRGRERGKHKIWSRLQVPYCQHRAPCGAQTHKLWDHTWAKVRCLTDWATQVLNYISLRVYSQHAMFRSNLNEVFVDMVMYLSRWIPLLKLAYSEKTLSATAKEVKGLDPSRDKVNRQAPVNLHFAVMWWGSSYRHQGQWSW